LLRAPPTPHFRAEAWQRLRRARGFAGCRNRCVTAIPRSHASAAFLRARDSCLSSHGLPTVALVLVPERIVELQQEGCHQRLAVTRTAGRDGAGMGAATAGGWSIEGPGAGGSPWAIALETIRGRKRGFDPQLQDPARIIWLSNRCINLKFYWQRTRKNPDWRAVAAGKIIGDRMVWG